MSDGSARRVVAVAGPLPGSMTVLDAVLAQEGAVVKSGGEIMEILEAFDLTGSYRAAAALVGCSHHTVAAHVAARDAGRPIGAAVPRERVIDGFLPKVEGLVDKTQGRVRAGKVHEKLLVDGFAGSERSTRRAVAEAKAAWRAGHRWVHRPWVTEPGLWLQ